MRLGVERNARSPCLPGSEGEPKGNRVGTEDFERPQAIQKSHGGIKVNKRASSMAVLVSAGALTLTGLTVSPGAAAQIDEIVVTAQKREERSIEVPISISAFSGDMVSRRGIGDVARLEAMVPSLTYDESLASSGARVRIRGIGGPAFTSGVETSVSVVQDEVVTGPSGSGLANLWDVERIEVLRGPQGTLAGKNATAGVIRVVSKAPTDEFQSDLNLRYTQGDFGPVGSDYWSTRVEGAVSGPITENLRGRISGFSLYDNDGHIDDVVREQTNFRKKRWGARGRVDYQQDRFFGDLIFQFERSSDRCCAPTFVDLDPSVVDAGLVPVLLSELDALGIEIGRGNRSAINGARIGEETRVRHLAATGSWQFDNGHEIMSITGWRSWKSKGRDDSDRTFFVPVDATQAKIDMSIVTQEIRLISPVGERLDYVVGLYAYFQDIDDNFIVGVPEEISGLPPSNAESRIKVNNYAAFANANYALNDKWDLFGGIRLIYEDLEISGTRSGGGALGLFPGQPDNNIDFRRVTETDTDFTGRLGLRYRWGVDRNIYASVSRGYKGIGLNNANSGSFFNNTLPVEPSILDPETVLAFELGSKNRLLDGALSLDVVLFFNRYKDFQTSAFEGETSSFTVTNAGEIELLGVELDITARPWEGATLYFGGAWIDGEFSDFTGAPCTALQVARGQCPPEGQDLSGRRINGTPEFQFTLQLEQDFTLGRFPAYATGEYSWKGSQLNNGDLDPLLKEDSYGVANFRLGMLPRDNIEVTAFVENAFNKTYRTNLTAAPVFPGVVAGYLAPGRVFGLGLRANL